MMPNLEAPKFEREKCSGCFKPLNNKGSCNNVYCEMFNPLNVGAQKPAAKPEKHQAAVSSSEELEFRQEKMAEQYLQFLEETPEQEKAIGQEESEKPEIIDKVEPLIERNEAPDIKKEIENLLKAYGIGPEAPAERLGEILGPEKTNKMASFVSLEILKKHFLKPGKHKELIEELEKSLIGAAKEIFKKALSKTLHEIV